MPSYAEWNEKIFHHFFNAAKRDRRASLAVDSESLAEVATEFPDTLDHAEEDFTMAVRQKVKSSATPFWIVFKEAREWWNQGPPLPAPPPSVGFLGACVLAASRMEMDEDRDIAAHNYYERLKELLDVQDIDQYHRWRITELWKKLIEWLAVELGGSLGICDAGPLGTGPYWQNVGYPVSQCLMREADRDHLPEFFHWAGLSPGDNIDPSTIMNELRAWSTRTTCTFSIPLRRRLRGRDSICLAIAERVCDEFARWNGIVRVYNRSGRQIKLCAGQNDDAVWELFFLLTREAGFPEGRFHSSEGWSFDLASSGIRSDWYDSTPPIDVTSEGLQRGFRLEHGSCFLEFHKSDLFIFEWGEEELPCWVERNRPRVGTECLILCHINLRDRVMGVLGELAGESWTEISARYRPLAGWAMFKNVKLRPSVGDLPDALSALKPVAAVELSLRDGLRLRRHGAYFHGGEPTIAVGETKSRVSVFLNGQTIAQVQDEGVEVPLASRGLSPGIYEIEAGDKKRRFEIVAASKQSVYSARSMRNIIGRGLTWESGDYHPLTLGCRNLPANDPDDDGVFICGGAMLCEPSKKPDPNPLVLTLKTTVKEYVFIGRHPGMVKAQRPDREFDKMPVALGFKAAWMVKRAGRRWKVMPVGKPDPPDASAALRRSGYWANCILHRKNSAPKSFLNIWKQYVRLAKQIAGEEKDP